MAKILMLAFFCCVAISVAQPFTPQPSNDYTAQITASTTLSPGLTIVGQMHVDNTHRGMRFDAAVENIKVTEVNVNTTSAIITFAPNSDPVCKTQYQPLANYNSFWWARFATYAGRDYFFNCEKFTFGIPDFVMLSACFASATTPTYMNSTVEFMRIGNNPLSVSVVFNTFVPGPQNPSYFIIPAICPAPSFPKTFVAQQKAHQPQQMTKIAAKPATPFAVRAIVEQIMQHGFPAYPHA